MKNVKNILNETESMKRCVSFKMQVICANGDKKPFVYRAKSYNGIIEKIEMLYIFFAEDFKTASNPAKKPVEIEILGFLHKKCEYQVYLDFSEIE
jgi:hypothetical protein